MLTVDQILYFLRGSAAAESLQNHIGLSVNASGHEHLSAQLTASSGLFLLAFIRHRLAQVCSSSLSVRHHLPDDSTQRPPSLTQTMLSFSAITRHFDHTTFFDHHGFSTTTDTELALLRSVIAWCCVAHGVYGERECNDGVSTPGGFHDWLGMVMR